MKKFTLMLLVILGTYSANALPTNFIHAINMVESGGKKSHVKHGDNGKAIGPLQIHKRYWQDARIKGQYSDCENYEYSVRVVTAYLKRFAPEYLNPYNPQALARIHNGGPDGSMPYMQVRTNPYWEKVKKYLDK